MHHKPYDWKVIFLEALRNMPVIRHGCDAAGVNRTTAWRARETDEEFAKAWDDALADGVDKAEQAAFLRAVDGFEEPIVYQGRIMWRYEVQRDEEGNPVIDELTGTPKYVPVLDATGNPVPQTIRKHSDALLALILKGRRKEVYAERTELTGADGKPMEVDQTVAAARVAQLLAVAKARKDFSDLA